VDPIESGDRYRSVVVRQHLPRQRITGKLLSNKALLIGRAGNDRSAAIEQQDRGTRMLRNICREVADPLQIDNSERDPLEDSIVSHDRKSRDQTWHVIDPVDQIVAEPEFTRLERIAEVRTVGNIGPDRQWFG